MQLNPCRAVFPAISIDGLLEGERKICGTNQPACFGCRLLMGPLRFGLLLDDSENNKAKRLSLLN